MRDRAGAARCRRQDRGAGSSTTTWQGVRQPGTLAEPIDRGFNRLAWAVPYLVGVGGFALDRLGRREMVATPRRRGCEPAGADERAPTPRSKRDWTRSSATSTRHGFNIFLRRRAWRSRSARSCLAARPGPGFGQPLVALTLLAAGLAGVALIRVADRRSRRGATLADDTRHRWAPRVRRSNATSCSRCERSRSWNSIARWGRCPRPTSSRCATGCARAPCG